jgi:hypothetical protein
VAVVIAALALTVLSAGRGSPMAHILSLAVEVATLWYLLTPRIHYAFRAEGAAKPD